jgi:hypothetical protein
MRRHAVAVFGLVVLSALCSWPLPAQLETAVAGADTGDNFCFLWNFFWMREALASGSSFFHSPLLFAPRGIDLALHTHTALPAWIGATALGGFSVAAALNITIVASLFLAAFCTYVLCWRLTRDSLASFVASIVFAGSPYLTARLYGHFNLTHAWVLPLFAWLAYEAIRTRSRVLAICAGAIWGLTAYIDYYYVVYQGVLVLTVWIVHAEVITVRFIGRTRMIDMVRRSAAILITITATLVVLISVTGGIEFRLWSMRVSAKSVFNPLQILWALAAVWAWTRFRPVLGRTGDLRDRRPELAVLTVSVLTFAVLSLPLLWRVAVAAVRGGYAASSYSWRSAPAGIDAATFLLGNPFHPIWGTFVHELYRTRDIGLMESSAFLGLSVLVLAGLAIRHCWGRFWVREWTVAGSVFLLWSLGPHLQVYGLDTGMILPNALGRFLPLVSNARMPGRAVVVVYLVLAVLSAVAIAAARQQSGRRRWSRLAMALIVVEFGRGPIGTRALPDASFYDQLRRRPEQGALLELPLGIRDGDGELGQLDERNLYFQTVHGRPLIGGFVARLPQDVRSSYTSDPLLVTLLQLSAGKPPVVESLTPRAVEASLAALSVTFVAVDHQTATAELIRFVAETMSLSLVASDGHVNLYVVVKRP